MAKERNFEGVQFAEIRKVRDPEFLDLTESLEVAYYGPRDANGAFIKGEGWRNGKSAPWHGYDVQATPAESKALFDQLHGEIWNQHHLALVEENEKQGQRYPLDKLDPMNTETGKRKSEEIKERTAGREESAAITKARKAR